MLKENSKVIKNRKNAASEMKDNERKVVEWLECCYEARVKG